MRIICKKPDYYDSIQAYGQDQNVVFLRFEKDFTDNYIRKLFDNKESICFSNIILDKMLLQKIGKKKYSERREFLRSTSCFKMSSIEYFIIGFCGEFYPCVRVSRDKSSACFYRGDDVEIPENIISYEFKHFSEKEADERKIKKFIELKLKKDDELFFHFKSPTLALNVTDFYSESMSDTRLHLNPLLSDFKFYRVKDSYTAFQDIYHYLSGVIGDLNDKDVSISDKDVRDAKGFDEWSFKKRPKNHKP